MKPLSRESSRTSHRLSHRRRLAQLLTTSRQSVQLLLVQARCLRRRISGEAAHSTFCHCVDALVSQLKASVRAVSARLHSLSIPPVVRSAAAHLHVRVAATIDLTSLPADLAASLIAEFQACGSKICSLFQIAREVHDEASASTAYVLMRTLEKQTWLLRSHADDTAHPFPFIARMA